MSKRKRKQRQDYGGFDADALGEWSTKFSPLIQAAYRYAVQQQSLSPDTVVYALATAKDKPPRVIGLLDTATALAVVDDPGASFLAEPCTAGKFYVIAAYIYDALGTDLGCEMSAQQMLATGRQNMAIREMRIAGPAESLPPYQPSGPERN
jgi:hypothetical protein